jgi:hypothetical protein
MFSARGIPLILGSIDLPAAREKKQAIKKAADFRLRPLKKLVTKTLFFCRTGARTTHR